MPTHVVVTEPSDLPPQVLCRAANTETFWRPVFAEAIHWRWSSVVRFPTADIARLVASRLGGKHLEVR